MLDLILAIPISSYEQHFPDFAPGLQVGFFVNEDHEIHRLSDKRLLRCIRGFSHEAFEANQTANGIIGVYRGGTTGMSCVPSFEKGMRFRSTHFAYNDASGFEAHARPQAFEHGHFPNSPEVKIILNGTL